MRYWIELLVVCMTLIHLSCQSRGPEPQGNIPVFQGKSAEMEAYLGKSITVAGVLENRKAGPFVSGVYVGRLYQSTAEEELACLFGRHVRVTGTLRRVVNEPNTVDGAGAASEGGLFGKTYYLENATIQLPAEK